MRLAVLPLAIAVIGLILTLTMRTLFGVILILAGVMSLFVFLGPALERIGKLLGTGQVRRTPRE